jgi:2'-5' RNA ligase
MQDHPDATLRLFIALWPTPAARHALRDWQCAWTWPAGAAVIAPERIHLTLHFLGQVAAARLDALRAALQPPAERFDPFELRLDRIEHWPHGLLVLSPSAAPEPLRRLHDRIGDALRGIGLPVESRAFRPHVTLARRAAGVEGPPAPEGLRWPVRGYALVQSANGYHTLQRYRCGAATGPQAAARS